MDIKGKTIVFVKEAEVKGKTIKNLSTSVSGKGIDEQYFHLFVKVKFAGKLGEKVASLKTGYAYELNVKEGFLTCEKWGADKIIPTYVITDAECLTRQEVKKNQGF